eukprot:864968-Rhodomonas_salina.1
MARIVNVAAASRINLLFDRVEDELRYYAVPSMCRKSDSCSRHTCRGYPSPTCRELELITSETGNLGTDTDWPAHCGFTGSHA